MNQIQAEQMIIHKYPGTKNLSCFSWFQHFFFLFFILIFYFYYYRKVGEIYWRSARPLPNTPLSRHTNIVSIGKRLLKQSLNVLKCSIYVTKCYDYLFLVQFLCIFFRFVRILSHFNKIDFIFLFLWSNKVSIAKLNGVLNSMPQRTENRAENSKVAIIETDCACVCVCSWQLLFIAE